MVISEAASEHPSRSFNVTIAGPIIEPSPRWIRVKLGEDVLADSRRALLVRDYLHGHLPTYYFPPQDVRLDLLDSAPPDAGLAGLIYWNVRTAVGLVENAAWMQTQPPPDLRDLAGYITFAWRDPVAWYEEEEPVFAHARDPYHRVDVLASSRHVRVEIAGRTIAETRHPFLLFETNLPARYYIPAADVRLDLLAPVDKTTRCPYKGIASYWSTTDGDPAGRNIVWSYQDPLPECPKIAKLLCFFNERVDLYVDGELQPRPHTPWSRD